MRSGVGAFCIGVRFATTRRLRRGLFAVELDAAPATLAPLEETDELAEALAERLEASVEPHAALAQASATTAAEPSSLIRALIGMRPLPDYPRT